MDSIAGKPLVGPREGLPLQDEVQSLEQVRLVAWTTRNAGQKIVCGDLEGLLGTLIDLHCESASVEGSCQFRNVGDVKCELFLERWTSKSCR